MNPIIQEELLKICREHNVTFQTSGKNGNTIVYHGRPADITAVQGEFEGFMNRVTMLLRLKKEGKI